MESSEGVKKMFRRSIIFVGFALLWLLPFVQSGEASYDYELGSYSSRDSQYRDAGDAEDLIERGRASVTDSPQFPEGIRLTAWANGEEEGFEPGHPKKRLQFTATPLSFDLIGPLKPFMFPPLGMWKTTWWKYISWLREEIPST